MSTLLKRMKAKAAELGARKRYLILTDRSCGHCGKVFQADSLIYGPLLCFDCYWGPKNGESIAKFYREYAHKGVVRP